MRSSGAVCLVTYRPRAKNTPYKCMRVEKRCAQTDYSSAQGKISFPGAPAAGEYPQVWAASESEKLLSSLCIFRLCLAGKFS